MTWWTLHVSKALAVVVAGVLMGKDLMDAVNYCLVSCLIEGAKGEVILTSIARFGLIVFIAVVNVVCFTYLDSPATVWINMTALGFITELSGGILDVAKRGLFGHWTAKTVT